MGHLPQDGHPADPVVVRRVKEDRGRAVGKMYSVRMLAVTRGGGRA